MSWRGGAVNVRVLQVPPERAAALARERMLDACLWYLPEPAVLPKVREAMEGMDIPALPVLDTWASVWESDLPACHVATDFRGLGRSRAEFLLRRGHRKVARLNATFYPYRGDEGESYQGFAAALGGYDPAWSVAPGEVAAKIPRLLDQGEVTAAVVNGGERQMRAALQAVDKHRNAGKLELLVDYVGMSAPELAAAFPHVKIVGVLHHPAYKLGRRRGGRADGAFGDGRPSGRGQSGLRNRVVRGEAMKRGRFFSLVELLVVIAIISVLASLLLPALKRAKDMALASQCQSNLRQCGIAEVGYASDNNDWAHRQRM